MNFLNQKSTTVTTELNKIILHLTQSPFHNDPDWEYLRKISAITKSINSVISSITTCEKDDAAILAELKDRYRRLSDNILFHELAHYQSEDHLSYYKQSNDFLLVKLYGPVNDKILKEIQAHNFSEAGESISHFLIVCLTSIANYSTIICEVTNRHEIKILAHEIKNNSTLELIEITSSQQNL